MNEKAYYYQAVEGVFTNWYQTLSQRLFEYRLEDNPPRAARAYALASIAHHILLNPRARQSAVVSRTDPLGSPARGRAAGPG